MRSLAVYAVTVLFEKLLRFVEKERPFPLSSFVAVNEDARSKWFNRNPSPRGKRRVAALLLELGLQITAQRKKAGQ
ncbi:MAG: hypothetical protein EA381_20185 [Planctomycetaceae bacterium]|nr:MAG: hypothetical protein EA381_20185 [Planctomycetaceae bacterium]